MREILSRKIINNKEKIQESLFAEEEEEESDEECDYKERFYSYGSAELEKARRIICEDSFGRLAARASIAF